MVLAFTDPQAEARYAAHHAACHATLDLLGVLLVLGTVLGVFDREMRAGGTGWALGVWLLLPPAVWPALDAALRRKFAPAWLPAQGAARRREVAWVLFRAADTAFALLYSHHGYRTVAYTTAFRSVIMEGVVFGGHWLQLFILAVGYPVRCAVHVPVHLACLAAELAAAPWLYAAFVTRPQARALLERVNRRWAAAYAQAHPQLRSLVRQVAPAAATGEAPPLLVAWVALQVCVGFILPTLLLLRLERASRTQWAREAAAAAAPLPLAPRAPTFVSAGGSGSAAAAPCGMTGSSVRELCGPGGSGSAASGSQGYEPELDADDQGGGFYALEDMYGSTTLLTLLAPVMAAAMIHQPALLPYLS